MRVPERAAYPSDLEDHIVLPNRRFLRIRPLRRCEEDTVRELYDHLSPRTRYLRFFSAMPRLPDSVVRMLACVDYRRQLALVAEHDNGNGLEIVGLASFGAIDDDNVEVALVIRDDWQRQRLGTALASRLLQAAEVRGFHRFIASSRLSGAERNSQNPQWLRPRNTSRPFRLIRLKVGDMRVLAICGSLQAKSGNLALLKTAAASMPPGVDLVLFDGLRDLPHFNPDIEASGVPESVTQWRLALTASDAVLIACPEYGFSLPGVLKNSIEWVIGSGELEQKVVAITAAVAGPERGRRGLQALRDSLSAVRVTIVGGEPITKGPGFETQVAALVQALVEATASSRDHRRVDGASPDP